VVEHALETVPREEADSLEAIRRADKLAREAAEAYCAQK